MRGRGFTVLELLLVMATIALMMAILIPVLPFARGQGRLNVCMAQLREFGVATGTYAADYEDRIWNFTWQKHNWQSQVPPSNPVPGALITGDNHAAAAQAIYIMRTRGNRPDIFYISGWIPHVLYTHLVVLDYIGATMPNPRAVCPEDLHRKDWQKEPQERFDKNFWLPYQPTGGTNTTKRWPYSASYQTVPASYDRSAIPSDRISQNYNATNTYTVPNSTRLGGVGLSDVAFPSQKVQLLDDTTRHLTKTPTYYSVPRGEQPYLMFDGSVRLVQARHVNEGWIPTVPLSDKPTQMTYTPQAWQAPTSSGMFSEIVIGRARWTRGGIKGIDFSGEEIDTGQ